VSSPIDFQKVINKNSKVDKFPCRRQCKIFWRTSLPNPPHTQTQITGYRHGRAYIISRRHCVTGTDSPAKTGTRNRFFTFLLLFSFLFIFPLQNFLFLKIFPNRPPTDTRRERVLPNPDIFEAPQYLSTHLFIYLFTM
jgi:hypothetical protein